MLGDNTTPEARPFRTDTCETGVIKPGLSVIEDFRDVDGYFSFR
jgi:hypothetical protein